MKNIEDLGANVYRFRYRGLEFGEAIAGFLSEHPELEVSAVTIEDMVKDVNNHVEALSYIVIFRLRNNAVEGSRVAL